jgi:hypothetical protein
MAKKLTKDEQIARLMSENARLERDIQTFRRDMEAARAALANGGTDSDYWRKSMAQQAFPKENPATVPWEDLDSWFSQRATEDADLLEKAERIAKSHDIDQAGDVDDILDRLDSALDDADKLKSKVCTLGDVYSVGVTDPDDIADTLEEWAAKGTADSVRADAWSLLAALDYDVRQVRFMDLDLDDGQIVFALKAQRRS